MISLTKSIQARPRSTNNKLWIALGVVLWLVFVFSQFPATWGAWFITRGGEQLALSGITGTLWNGRASLASVKLNQKDFPLGQLEWDLHPLSLLLLKPCATVETRQGDQEIAGEICGGLGGSVELHETDITVLATSLQELLPVPVEGKFTARIEQFQRSDNAVKDLKGVLTWTGARINNGSTWMDVGNYGAELNDNGQGGVNATIFNTEGPVQLQLEAAFAAAGGGTVKGNLSMNSAFEQEINAGAWISMFAKPDGADEQGNNRYIVDTAF